METVVGPNEGRTTFFDLPLDLRDIIWSIHRKLVFNSRCRVLDQALKQTKNRCHVGVHSSYSPVHLPSHSVWVHIDGPNGKVYCFGTRDKYKFGERVQIREYQQYDKGYLEVYIDDSHGKWNPVRPTGVQCAVKCEYPGRPQDTEYCK